MNKNNTECHEMTNDEFLEEIKQECENDEYLKKSIKCWKEYFLKGDTENDEN